MRPKPNIPKDFLPTTVTFICTRKCDLNCPECAIAKNQLEREMSLQELKEALLNARKLLGNVFFCNSGGEPLLLDIENLVEFMNKHDIIYGLTSNSVSLTKSRVDDLVKVGLKNWTCSINSLDNQDIRDRAGFKAIAFFKGNIPDVHVTVTIGRNNYREIPVLTGYLSSLGTWVEHTPWHWAKNENYIFASDKKFVPAFEPEDKDEISKMIRELLKLKRRGYLIHCTSAYLREWPNLAPTLNWHCSFPSNLVFDADGSLMPCLQLKGSELRKLNILEGFTWKDYFEAWEADVMEQCEGCFWDCQWESEYAWNKFKNREKVLDWFIHKGG